MPTMTTCKGLLIDTLKCQIRETTFEGLEGMQKAVGGYIETAYTWANGDTLYVDEEGLYSSDLVFFTIAVRPDQPLAGQGLLVGRELGESGETAPPIMTAEELRAIVGFL